MTEVAKGTPPKFDYVTDAMINWFSLSTEYGHDSIYQGAVAVAKTRTKANANLGGYARLRDRFLDEGGVLIAKMRVIGTPVPEAMTRFYNTLVGNAVINPQVVNAATEVNTIVENMVRTGEVLV